jgi:hypothetical protein
MNFEDFLSRLDGVRRSGSGGSAKCPAHEDGRASLSVGGGEDGRILLKCHAGCSAESIVTALGLTLADLMPEPTEKKRRRCIADTYDYRDADGTLLLQVVRYDPKDFRQRRPDGKDGWTWNLDGVKRVLYLLPELIGTDPSTPVFIVEGEKDADRLASLGLVATTSPGGAGKWRSEFAEVLQGRNVVVLPDNDGPGAEHGTDVARSLRGVAGSLRVVHLPNLPNKGDVSDWLEAGHTADELERLATEAPEWTPPRTPNLSALLGEIVRLVRRFVVMSEAQAVAWALWVVHTHALDAAEETPYLSVTSPEKRSGKTRTLEVSRLVVARPWFTGRVSAASRAW